MTAKVVPFLRKGSCPPCPVCGCETHFEHLHDMEFEPTCVSCLTAFFGATT